MTLEIGFRLNDRYRITGVLGRGGFGAVFSAWDENLGLACAVKENLGISLAAERQFRREAKLLASLSHPHLPRVTNHFILGGRQYLVMDFVGGEDLSTRLEREGPLPLAEVLAWADQIGDALDYLHSLDPPVVHRDIKPANIKITPAGEAMLVDFGIAKAAAADQKTATGAKGVTPGFAPPEQYDLGQTDARTDLYALGATLYNVLTGQLPPDSVERLLGIVELPAPESLRPDLSPNVVAAIQRAMQIRAEDRFQQISELRAALADRDYRRSASEITVPKADKPAPSRRASLLRRPGRVRGRVRATVLALLAILGIGAAAAVVFVGPAALEAGFRRLVGAPVEILPTPPPEATPISSLPEGVPTQTLALPTELPPGALNTPLPTPTATPFPQEVTSQNASGWRLFAQWRKEESSVPFALAPDGQTVALVSRQGVDIFDLLTGELRDELQGFIVGRDVIGLAYLDDSVLVLFEDEVLRYSLESKNLIGAIEVSGRGFLVSADQSLLAVHDKYVSLLELEGGRLVATVGGVGLEQDFTFSPDGDYFALTKGNGVELYLTATGRLERTLKGHGEPTAGLSFTADGGRLVAASGDVWEVAGGELIANFDSSTDLAALSPNGEVIVGNDGSVWALESGELLTLIPFEDESDRNMEFSPDGQFLARQNRGGVIEVWTVDPRAAPTASHLPLTAATLPIGEQITPLNISRLAPIGDIAAGIAGPIIISPDWTTAASWSQNRLSLVSLEDGSQIGEIRTSGDIIDAAYLGPEFITVINARTGVERWEVWTQRLKQQYAYAGSRLVASPEGSWFAIQEKYIQVVDPLTGERRYNLGSADSGQQFSFTPDGTQLAIAFGSGVSLWDLDTGRMARQFSGHGAPTRGLVFTPDGSRLLSDSGDVWDVQTGTRIAAFDSSADQLALSPDGSLVVGEDGRLWDGETGQYLGDLGVSASHLWITPNNRRIVFQTDDGQGLVYGIVPLAEHSPASPAAVEKPALVPLTDTSIRDLGLLGWWGDDPVLEVLYERDSPERGVRWFGGSGYEDIAPSPDGEAITALYHEGIALLDPENGEEVDRYEIFLNPDSIEEIAYLDDSLLVLKRDAGLERWDLSTRQLIARYALQGEGLVTSSDARVLALRAGGRVLVVEATTGELLLNLPVFAGRQPYAFSPDGSHLALSRGSTVELWDLESGQRTGTLAGAGPSIDGLAFTPDGSRLVAGSGAVWELESGARELTFEGVGAPITVDPQGEFFVGADGALRSLNTGDRIATLFDLRAPPERLFIVGNTLVGRTGDGRTSVWGVRAEEPPSAAAIPADAINAGNAARLGVLAHIGRGRLLEAMWSPDERHLAVNTTQNTLIYRAENLERVGAFLDAKVLAFDGNGDALIGGSHPLQLIDTETAQVLRDFELIGITAAAFSPDRSRLAIGGRVSAGGVADGLAVVDLSAGLLRQIEAGRGIYDEVLRLQFSPDGSKLVESFRGAIYLWDVESGTQLRQAITGNTRPAAISPDGQYLAYFTNRFIIEDLVAGGRFRTINADGTPVFPTGLQFPSLRPLDYGFGEDGQLQVFYRSLNRRTLEEQVALIEWDIRASPVSAEIRFEGLLGLSDLTGVYAQDYADERPQHTPAFVMGPLGRMLVSLTGDGVIRVWETGSLRLLAASDPDPLDRMALSPDGVSVAIPNALGEIQIVQLRDGESLRKVPGSWFPDRLGFGSRSILMALQPDGALALIDTARGEAIESYAVEGYDGPGYFALSQDGRLFANLQLFGGRNLLQLYSLSPQGPLFNLDRYPVPAAPQFSPEGDLLAIARRGKVELWDLHIQAVIAELEGVSGAVGPVAFSPDGTRLVAATGEIWDVATGELVARFETTDPTMTVRTNGFVIVGQDGTLWNLESGDGLGQLEARRAVDFAFTAGGERLVWLREGGVIEIWGVED